LKNILEYILFISLSFFVRIIGLTLSRKFANVLAFVFFYIIRIRKEVVLENLKFAFPDYTEEKIKIIAYQNFKSICITLVEILSLPWIKKEQVNNILLFDNPDLLISKFKEGNGLIVLSGHFGNWEYLATLGAYILRMKFHVVVKPQRNPYVDRWMNNYRTKWNNEVIPLGPSIRNVYSVLIKKGILAMVADQRGPEESIKLEFFGRKTSVYTGPAILSLKSNAPLIFGIAIRQEDFSYKIFINEISRDNLPEDYDEKVKMLSERILRHLESIISQYPEQWLWMHKRWKH
jgi:Kdo2-lipid IVA lauroyltransferase/acyltransferase